MSESTPYATPASNLQDTPTEFCRLKLFSFQGRIGRVRYLAYGMGLNILFNLIFGVVSATTMALPEAGRQVAMGLTILVAVISLIVFGAMMVIRRLHDLDQSGWFALFMLFPLVNLFFSLYLMFAPGTKGKNSFDAPPPPNSGGVIALVLIYSIIVVTGIIAAISIPAYNAYIEAARQAQQQQP